MQRIVFCGLLVTFRFLFYFVCYMFLMDASKQKRVHIEEMPCDILFHNHNVQFVSQVG